MQTPSSLLVPFVNEMLHRVVSGQYAPQSTLPTEAQLGEAFRLSRTVIREGVKVLIEKGLILVDRGRGTRVLGQEHWRALDPDILAARLEIGDREVMLAEIFVLRKAIEPELAALAATRADDVGLARLGSRVDTLINLLPLTDHREYLRADGAFHDCIAELSQSSLASSVVALLVRPFEIQRDLTSHIPEALRKGHEHHLKIFRCVRERDAQGARAAMRTHLEWAESRLDLTRATPDDQDSSSNGDHILRQSADQ